MDQNIHGYFTDKDSAEINLEDLILIFSTLLNISNKLATIGMSNSYLGATMADILEKLESDIIAKREFMHNETIFSAKL